MSSVVVRSISASSRPIAAQCSRRIASRSRELVDGAHRVPLVAVPGQRPQRLLRPRSADHDRQPHLHRPRRHQRVVHRVDRPVVRDQLAVEQPAHQHHGLVEPVEPLAEAAAEVDPVGVVLALEPGAAEPEDRAAARQVVERRRELRRQARVAERVGGDHQPERRPLGDLRPAREDRPALEDRALPRADDRVQVVPRPERRGARRGRRAPPRRGSPASSRSAATAGTPTFGRGHASVLEVVVDARDPGEEGHPAAASGTRRSSAAVGPSGR